MKYILCDGTMRRACDSDGDGVPFVIDDGSLHPVLPAQVRRIDVHAFENMHSLRTVTLPEGLQSIGRFAFRGCTALRRIRLPDSVCFLGDSVFEGCTELEELFVSRAQIRFKNAFRGCRSIITPAFDAVPAVLRRACVMGFAGHEQLYGDVLRAKYLTHLRKNSSVFCKAAFSHPPLLHLMCRESLIKPQYIDQYLFHALRCGNPELTFAMLRYAREHRPDGVKPSALI